jgi:hypothetical protein
MSGTYALEIEAEYMPRHVGPFETREHADAWARNAIGTGSWTVYKLVKP